MMQIVNQGQKRIFEIVDETINGLLFRFDIKVGNSMSKSELAKCRISLYRTQDGKKVLNLTPKGMKLSELFDVIFANDSERGQAILTTKQITDVTPDGFYVLPYKFGNMNLTNGRGLLVEIENGGSVENPGDKFELTVFSSYSVGVETELLQIEEVLLDSAAKNYDEQFGNNVVCILSPNLSDLNRVEVISDKQNYDAEETFVRSQIFDKVVVEDSGEPNYSLFLLNAGNTVLNRVRLKLEFDAVGSRQLFVVRKITTPQMLSNAMAKTNKHLKENVEAISSNVFLSQK